MTSLLSSSVTFDLSSGLELVSFSSGSFKEETLTSSIFPSVVSIGIFSGLVATFTFSAEASIVPISSLSSDA